MIEVAILIKQMAPLKNRLKSAVEMKGRKLCLWKKRKLS
jgi:hypothetical protein